MKIFPVVNKKLSGSFIVPQFRVNLSPYTSIVIILILLQTEDSELNISGKTRYFFGYFLYLIYLFSVFLTDLLFDVMLKQTLSDGADFM